MLGSLVAVYRGVFLYGDSGNGKSSLVNAGLLPQVCRRGLAPVRVRVQPRAGEELVIEQIALSDDGAEILPCVLAPDNDGSSRLVLSIAEFEERARAVAQERRPLLVFDQFEEILTLFEDKQAVASRRALTDMIVRLLRDPLPVKLLFAFREDYLGKVKQLLAARPELVDQALRLGAPSADEVETIIRGPFERFPGHFERELDPALAQRLRAALAERFGTGDVSLSEVQTVCLRLWQSSDPSALLANKGVQGLLEDELGEALDAFRPALRTAAVALLSEMVTSAGTRNVISAEDLRQRVREEDGEIPVELLDEALDRLERDSKLVRRERRRDLYLYEITSEFIVPWISRRREELQLAHARRRERRRMRILGSIAGGLLVLAAIVAAVAVWALAQRSDAQRKASEATSLALATSSAGSLTPRPDVSAALAFEAYRERPRPETSSAVVRALNAARWSGLRGVLAVSSPVNGVAFSPDGSILASAEEDHTVSLWDAVTRSRLARLADHGGRVGALAFSSDGKTLASGGDDGTVRLWDTATHRLLARIKGHGSINAVAFSRDRRTLAYGGDNQLVDLWDVVARRPLGRLRGHNGSVSALAFSPDGTMLASGSNDSTVGLWSTAARTLLRRIAHTDPVRTVAFSPDGATLAYAGDDSSIRLWDTTARRQRDQLTSSTGRVFAVAFSTDGRTLAYAGDAGRVGLWDVARRMPLDSLKGHNGVVDALAFSPDGGTLASGGGDTTVRLWSVTRKRLGRLAGHQGPVFGVAYSPDGRTLASAGYDATVRLWDPARGTQVARLTGNTDAVNAVAFSASGETLASGGADGTVGLWNARTHRRLWRVTTGSDTFGPRAVNAVAFGRDARTLAVGGDDAIVRLLDVATAARRAEFPSGVGGVNAVAFSPDGRTLAYAGDRDIGLWSAVARRPLGRLRGHDALVEAIAFSRDGRTLASASNDNTVRLWNVATRRPLRRLSDTGPVGDVAFSPDGRWLAYGGENAVVRVWDTVTRTETGSFPGHVGPVNALAFSRDGTTIVVGGNRGTIRVWKAILWRSREALRATVCDLVGTVLSRSDWNQFAAGIPYRRSCT